MKKEECLKVLRDNELFKELLSKSTNEAEKNAIKVHAEVFVLKFFEDVIDPLREAIKNDPESVNKAFQELNDSLIKSGSKEA